MLMPLRLCQSTVMWGEGKVYMFHGSSRKANIGSVALGDHVPGSSGHLSLL